MRCIHTSWVRTRSSTGSPVSASRTVDGDVRRLARAVVGRARRASTSRPASGGGRPARCRWSSIDAHRGPHRHAHAFGPGQHARSCRARPRRCGWRQVNAGAEREGDDGDRRPGRRTRRPGCAAAGAGSRAAVAGRRKRRSRSALVTTLTELIAIAAAASTGSSSSPSRVQRAGGDRDEQRRCRRTPREALLDRGDGAPGQRDGGDDAAQVAADQGDVGGRDRDVGAGADRDAEVGLASAGASLMPSPTIATTCPSACSAATRRPSRPGSTSASTWSMPTWAAIGVGGGACCRR